MRILRTRMTLALALLLVTSASASVADASSATTAAHFEELYVTSDGTSSYFLRFYPDGHSGALNP